MGEASTCVGLDVHEDSGAVTLARTVRPERSTT